MNKVYERLLGEYEFYKDMLPKIASNPGCSDRQVMEYRINRDVRLTLLLRLQEARVIQS